VIEDNERVEPDVDDSAFRQEASRRSELVLDRVITSPEIQESLGFTLISQKPSLVRSGRGRTGGFSACG
jgi:hypothetical protein